MTWARVMIRVEIMLSLSLALAVADRPPSLWGQDVGDGTSAPLFASHDVLDLTLVADFDRLDDDRAEENEERPATLHFAGPDGAQLQLDIQVRTRGNFRLRRSTCAMPNLRLNIRTGEAEGTVFEGQDRLKLVGHCRDRDDYEQNVLEEYAAYRLYNVITDVSFRVRLVRMTHVDANGARDPVTRFGFLIEHVDALAARLGGIAMEVTAVNPMDLAGEPSVRLDLFQYMIGNADFSTAYFHNGELIRLSDASHHFVPYDFDFAGIVDAPYATPAPELGIRSVRERVYRGFCRPNVDMASQYVFFRERREAFSDVYRELPGLTPRNVERAIEYLDGFFETIDSESRARSRIERRCRSAD